jgi:DNA polymerase I
LDRNFTELEVRRAFTSFQRMTILEESHQSILIVEHDFLLYGQSIEHKKFGLSGQD